MSTLGQEIPEPVLGFLGQQNTLTLATASSGGIPRATTFLYVNDGPTLYFWTRSSTVTARHIQQNPSVSFTIDEFTDDLNSTRGVQGAGECSVLLSGEQIAKVADLFGQKFPSLSPGATMSISFFRISPTELEFIDNSAGGRKESTPGVFGADFHRERSFSVLNALPMQRVEAVTANLQTVSVNAGETPAKPGGPADKLFIIKE